MRSTEIFNGHFLSLKCNSLGLSVAELLRSQLKSNGRESNRYLQLILNLVEGGNTKRKSVFSLGNDCGWKKSVLFKTPEYFKRIQDFLVFLDFSHSVSAGVKLCSKVEDFWACGTVTLRIPCKDCHICSCTVNCVYPNWHVTFWWKLIFRIMGRQIKVHRRFSSFHSMASKKSLLIIFCLSSATKQGVHLQTLYLLSL